MPTNMVKWKERFYKLFWLSMWISSSMFLIWIKWTSDSFSNAVRILMNNNKQTLAKIFVLEIFHHSRFKIFKFLSWIILVFTCCMPIIENYIEQLFFRRVKTERRLNHVHQIISISYWGSYFVCAGPLVCTPSKKFPR